MCLFILTTYICFVLLKRKRHLFTTTDNLHNSTFPSFKFFLFTEEDANENRKEF